MSPTENGPAERCVHCGDVWSYPPIGSEINAQAKPTETSQDLSTFPLVLVKSMNNSAQALQDHFNQYYQNRLQAYNNWIRQHSTEACRMNDGVSSDSARAETTEGTSTNNKRKSDFLSDDGHVFNKFRRLSCTSPLQSSQLTPPPDHLLSSSPPHNVTNHNGAYRGDPAPT